MAGSTRDVLYNICDSISCYDDDRKLIHKIMEDIAEHLGIEVCVLRILDYSTNELVVYAMHGINSFPAAVSVGKGPLGRAVEAKKPIIVDDTQASPCDECKQALDDDFRSLLAMPMLLLGKPVGGIMLYSKSVDKFKEADVDTLLNMLTPVAAVLENRRIARDTISTFVSLARALEVKDPYTQGHSERVTLYSVGVGVAMGLEPDELRSIKIAGPMHDIGKIGVSESILHKPGKLSKDEWGVMLEHPVIGERIVDTVRSLHGSLAIIRNHHENFDGSGYPDKIGSDDIPRAASVVHVADAYDAMTSTRPYRSAMSHADAVEELRKNASTQFDPDVVAAFCDTISGPQVL